RTGSARRRWLISSRHRRKRDGPKKRLSSRTRSAASFAGCRRFGWWPRRSLNDPLESSAAAQLGGNSRSREAQLLSNLDDVRRELARANRILAHEDVLDAFGHVSVRHPDDPGRYLLSRSRGPELVQPDDILEFTLDSEPVVPPTRRLYSERVIHGCIYQARPDVHAVVHHHAPSIMPFVIAGVDLVPVFHLGATMGTKAPFWDGRDEFGDTSLLVIKPEEGRSLARALGSHAMVLMRRHGATVVGDNLHQV